MFVIDCKKDQIILKENVVFLCIGVLAVIMAIMGACFLIGLSWCEGIHTFMDLLGVMFISVWLLGLLTAGIVTLEGNSKRITINDEGISSQSWFAKKDIKWSDVADWGLSYYGQTRGEGNTYYLYFSQHPCSVKNDCKKLLKGKMVKTFIIGNEYDEAVSQIIPFCMARTTVKPFIGVDKFHFLF